jgi:hypothetical protein
MNLLTLACLTLLAAEPPTGGDPATLLTERGKQLLADDFAAVPAKPWNVGKGKWEVVDGALRVAELPSDMHGAVARRPLNVKDVVIQYGFKLDGCKQTSLSINDAKGHCCRVVLSPTGLQVRKDSHDKNVTDKGALLGEVKKAIKPGEWHTVVVELYGKEMLARLDGEVVAFGAHDSLDVTKTNFGLTCAGEAVWFRNLRVWEAQPNKGWEATKAKLQADKPAKGG